TLQALLRNPLAEPYILGLSGGAALGVVTAIVLGLTEASAWILPIAAFTGAACAVLLVLRIASSASTGFEPRVLILGGVVLGVFFNAAIMLLLSVASGEALRSAIFWTMGSFGTASWQDVALLAAPALPASLLLWARARDLDLLVLGEDTAAYLGTKVRSAKLLAFGLASLLAAAGVAIAGVIGFVGLVVPHAARILWGSAHRFLLPAAFLLGAAFLVLADVAARLVRQPSEIPVGVVTAFVGVPVFVWLLRRAVIQP
ncbi:MAG: FecCD family ABC transporter permease, partial [Gemmatimonadota bacterium]